MKKTRKAVSKKPAAAKKKSNGGKVAAKKSGARMPESNAIGLLMKDHREVQKIFDEYEKLAKKGAGNERQKRQMVERACEMLTVHTQIEEQIFYPAAREALEGGVEDEELMDEALVEHDAAKELIAQLEDMRPGDHLYDAKFIVLGEMINHHVEEEESELFPKVKKLGLDLEALGEEMMELKRELEGERSGGQEMPPRRDQDVQRGGYGGYQDYR